MVKGKKIADIKGYEGYAVCESGRVYSLLQQFLHPDRTGELAQRIDRGGYTSVRFQKDGKSRTCWLHRLLAEAFIQNPLDLPEVNHRDGNPLNNRLSNLEWCTHQENCIHAYQLGLNSWAKQVVDTFTGEVFPSLKQAADAIGIPYSTCRKYLKNKRPAFRLQYLGQGCR